MKHLIYTGGDGLTGETGLQVREKMNVQVSGDTYYIPENFDFSVSLVSLSNRTWVITYEHTLANNITIPEGVTLFFDGGRILGAYTITGNVTKILNPRNTHIFALVTNFAGSWGETEATPMWWGAKLSPNPDTFVGIDSTSPMIQKLFDSPFQPVFPVGYYYIDAPTVITRMVTVDFGPSFETMALARYRNTRVWRNDHVRFYTDQDINFWEPRTHAIHLLGGVMDVYNAQDWDSAIYYIHCDYMIFEGTYSGHCQGNITNVRRLDSKGKVFHWDTHNATKDWGYGCRLKIHIKSDYIAQGVVIEDPAIAHENVTGTWFNLADINVWVNGARIAADIRGYEYARVYGQDQAVLHESEKDTHKLVFIKGSGIVDIHIADMFSREENGYWYHKAIGAYKVDTSEVYITGAYSNLINRFDGYVNKTQFDVSPLQSITQLRQTGDQVKCFISDLNNLLPIYAQDAEIKTIKIYDGSTLNFDTDLLSGQEYSLAETDRIEWSGYLPNPENLFRYRGNPVYFSVIDPRLTDFIEIRLKFTTNNRFDNFWIRLADGRSATQRIQLITVDSSNNRVMDEWQYQRNIQSTSASRIIKFPIEINCKEMIVRLIGFLGIYSQNRIEDIATAGYTYLTQSYVNRLEKPRNEYHLMLNQTGTDAPTLVQLLNPYAATITTTRQGVGSYRLNVSTTAGKVMPVRSVIYTDLGSIILERYNGSYYTITTRDLNDALSDGILINQPFIINRYW